MALIEISPFITHDTETNVFAVTPGASVYSLQNVIWTAPAGSTLLFKAGTHQLSEKLTIDRSDIVLKGEGEGATTIVGGTGLQSQIFFFVGAIDEAVNTHVTVPIVKGASTITLNDVSGFSVGDTLYVAQTNDETFILENYPNVLGRPGVAESPLRESMGEITAINGNEVTLSIPIAYDMAAGESTFVQRWQTLKNVGLSEMTFTYATTGTPDPNLLANAIPSMDNADAVVFNMVIGAQVSNVGFVNPTSTALEIRNVIDAHVDGLTVQGAFNKDEANGYGLHIAGSFNGVYENLTITDTRHAVVFSSWNAEVNNYVQVDYTNRDINYHGSDDYGNVVEVNRAVYKEVPNIQGSIIGLFGQNHPSTDLSKNTTLFGYVKGGSKAETLYGFNGGSEMYGMKGDDVLVGGNGVDVLSGGMGADVLTGGTGNDRFVLSSGDGTDVVSDFTEGDKIVLNNFFVGGFSDIVMRQVGADAEVVMLASAKLTDKLVLRNVDVSSLDASDFVIAPPAVRKVDATLTAAADVVQAGSSNDFVRALAASIGTEDVIHMGGGVDSLRIEKSTFSLDTALLEGTSGIDVIDTSQATASSIVITQAFLDTTDTGDLIINHGSKSIASLDVSGLNAANQVSVRGSGSVTLTDGVANLITLTSLSTGKTFGGTGNDTFLIKGKNKGTLTGDEGDDIFRMYGDFLNSGFKMDGGLGDDTLYLHKTVNWTLDDVKYLKGMEHLVFHETGNLVTLSNSFSLDLDTLEGRTADMSVTLDVSALTAARTFTLSKNIDAVFSGSSTAALTIMLGNASVSVVGSDGADRIFSGTGANDMAGGTGSDTFVFTDTVQFGDVISDFATAFGAADRLDLSALFDANGLGSETVAGAFANGILVLEQLGADTALFFDKDGTAGGAFAASKVVTLEDVLATAVTQNLIDV